jgi:hypothetical protein
MAVTHAILAVRGVLPIPVPIAVSISVAIPVSVSIAPRLRGFLTTMPAAVVTSSGITTPGAMPARLATTPGVASHASTVTTTGAAVAAPAASAVSVTSSTAVAAAIALRVRDAGIHRSERSMQIGKKRYDE